MAFDLSNWLLVFVRVGALLAVFPIFSAHQFPVQLRLALGVLTALLVAPLLPAVELSQQSLPGLIGLIAGELGIGLLLGFVSRLVFYALEVTGSVLSMEMGLNMAAVFNPFTNARSDAPGMLLYFLGGTLLLTLNVHHWLLAAFQRSYELLPIGGAHLTGALFNDVVGRTSHVLQFGVVMAAPVIAISFLITLLFAILGRAVPQMNVFTESFAFKALAGLAVFGLTLNLFAQHLASFLRRLPEDFLRVAQLLGTH